MKKKQHVKYKARVLDVGPDNRNVYTSDPDARGGKRSATNSRSAGKFVGYELHVVSQVRDIHPGDHVETATLGPDVPRLIVSVVLKPAASHRAFSVVGHLIGLKQGRWSQLEEVVFDRGYSELKAVTSSSHCVGLASNPSSISQRRSAVAGRSRPTT